MHGSTRPPRQETPSHNRKIRRWTRASVAGAIVSTALTLIILGINIRSIQETRRATHYASRAVAAATEQARIAGDTEKRQLRAYIGAVTNSFYTRGGNSPECLSTGQKTCVIFKIKNYGLTPAVRPRHCLGFFYGPPGFVPDLRAQNKAFSGCANTPAANTFPQDDPTVTSGEVPAPIDPNTGLDLVSELENKSMVLYFLSKTTYYDVFGDVHHTYIYRQMVPAKGENIKGITFMRCNSDNAYQDD